MALGEKLKQAREARGLTHHQVAEATHMMVQLVEELEREDFHRIAAVIYGKGFIRLFAEQVGLDPEPLVREYLERHSDSARDPKGRFVTDGTTVIPRSAPAREEAPAPDSPRPPASPAPAETPSAPARKPSRRPAAEAEDVPDLFSLDSPSPPRAERSTSGDAAAPRARPPSPPAPVLPPEAPEPAPPRSRIEPNRALAGAVRTLRRATRHARRRIEQAIGALGDRLNPADPALRRIFAVSLVGVLLLIVLVTAGRALFHGGDARSEEPPVGRPLARERIFPPPQPYID